MDNLYRANISSKQSPSGRKAKKGYSLPVRCFPNASGSDADKHYFNQDRADVWVIKQAKQQQDSSDEVYQVVLHIVGSYLLVGNQDIRVDYQDTAEDTDELCETLHYRILLAVWAISGQIPLVSV